MADDEAEQLVSGAAAVSKVERIKAASNHLRGTIASELNAPETPFTEESYQLLKFHGIYQGDDRDRRKEARAKGLDKHWQMMIRTRIPGGKLTPEGYLAHDDLAQKWGNGTIRITTRQAIQLHGVLKRDLRSTIKGISEALMSSLGGCGDQERNILCCPAPEGGRFREDVDRFLAGLVGELTARTGAYHEIWIDGELADRGIPENEAEDLYGETYLPRKFKTAIAIEGDNCVDVYSNDLGLVAMRGPDGGLAGVNILVGGGLGRTANKPETYPAVAVPLAFVASEHAVASARAVVEVQRDFGDRTNRRHARLKYLIADRGTKWFRERVQERVDFKLRPPRPMTWTPVDDHLGWHQQPDGKLYYGLFVENGRIKNEGPYRLRTAMRKLVEELRPVLYLTPQQNLLMTGLTAAGRGRVEAILTEHGVPLSEQVSKTVRHSLACPAYPTCGLAVAEAERSMPSLIRTIEGIVAGLGLADERISYRMTGCPNGCARPYLGDVGFVGTTLGKYDVFLGGDFGGTRLNTLYARNVPYDQIPELLRGPLASFAAERIPGEGFGDWCHRVGVGELQQRFVEVVA